MPFIPVYFKEEDLPLANLLASRLQLDTSPSLRNSITNLLAQAQVKAELTPIPTRVKAVALPQRPMLEEDPQPRLSRGPDKVRRKSPKHPKSIQEYILDHKGKTVTARDVVKEARKHQVHLNLHSVGSIMSQMWREGVIVKTKAPGRGFHSYTIPK